MRLSSQQTGTDITVEPRVVSKPVEELTDEELLEEMEKMRGMRGVAVTTTRRGGGGPRKQGPVMIDEIG